MDCERVDLLLGLLEDELDESERPAVEAHLEGCDVCRETVDAYRSTAEALSELPEERPSDEARGKAYAAVMELMEQEAATAAPKAESHSESPVESASDAPVKRGLVIPFVQLLTAAACVMLAVSFLMGPDVNNDATTATRTPAPEGLARDEADAPQQTAPAGPGLDPASAPSGAASGEYEDTERDFVRQVAEDVKAKAKAQRLQLQSELQRSLEKSARKETSRKNEESLTEVDLRKSELAETLAQGNKAKLDRAKLDRARRRHKKAKARALSADADEAPADGALAGEGAGGGGFESKQRDGFSKDADGALPEEEAELDDDAGDFGRRGLRSGATPDDADAPAADDKAADEDMGDSGPADMGREFAPGKGATGSPPPAPMAKAAEARARTGTTWRLSSPSGDRIYHLLADASVVYQDVALESKRAGRQSGSLKKARQDGGFMTSGGLVRVLRVPDGNGTKIGRAARGTTAKPKADFRVAEELLAIVASELNASANEPGAAVQTRAPSRKTSRQARAIALLRVLGERVPANENLTALRRRVQLLQVDHTRSMKRMRSGPALDLEEAQGR